MCSRWLAVPIVALFAALASLYPQARHAYAADASQKPIRLAQAASEKEAFESAKELGTIEAWEAFLNNYPNGFRADLARAYVKRLGNETIPAPAAAPAPAPAPAAPQPVAQPSPPPPAPAPNLQPVHLGPGSSPWRNGTYSLDEGNASAYSASVESAGLAFTLYCNSNRTLTAVLGEKQRGVYPQFDQRIEQGLDASRGQYGTPGTRTSITFSNGSEEIVSAHVMGLTGEVAIGMDQQGGGFHPQGSFLTNVMGENTMTISATPFSATFQLTGSRLAVCNVLKRCGVSIGGCARYNPAPVSAGTPKKKYVKKKGCPGGTVFLEGQCIKKSQVTSFCGPGYMRKGSKCVSRYSTASGQQPQQPPQQQAPNALQIIQGIAGALQQQKGKCPPGKVWEVNSCVEDD